MGSRATALGFVGWLAVAAAVAVAVPATATPQPTPKAPPPAVVDALADRLGISPDAARARLANQERAHQVVRRLPKSVRHAGFWFDAASGRLTVAVTSAADARAVTAAGAVPSTVTRGPDRLGAILAEVRAADLSGVYGYGIDPVTNTVRVGLDRTTAPVATQQFLASVDGVRINAVDGRPQQQDGTVQPGNPWWPGTETYNCSVGFGATDASGGTHFVTAGHCTNDADQPAYGETSQQNRIGTSNIGGTHSINAREGDMGVVAVTEPGWELSAEVNTWGGEPITVADATDAIVGDAVCHSGNTAPNFECGTVSAVNQTIDYGNVVVEGLTTTDACSEGGDSGGAWLVGDQATGVHSGGYSSCSSPPAEDQSIFQPVPEALAKWHLTLYTGQ